MAGRRGGQREHARRVRRPAAAQAARAGGRRADRDRARRRLRPAVSLRNRVTIATVITLGTGLLIVGVALNLVLANRLVADAQTILENRAGALLATVDARGPALRVHDSGGDAVLDEQAWGFDTSDTAGERPPPRPHTQAPAGR